MSFYSKLREALRGKIPEEVEEKLPRSYALIGKIALVKLQPEAEKYKKEIGEAMLEIIPARTVCAIKEIKNVTRRPIIEIIAGEKNTVTMHREHGCVYKIDVAKFMFSKGNKAEKMRIAKQVKEGEIIVDMFAGIGYFSIPLAKHTKAKKIYAIDINPEAIACLKENAKLNRVEEKIIAIEGDCREVCKKLAAQGVRADRIIMGYIFGTHEFLPAALEISRKGTVIHYHFLERHAEREIEKIAQIARERGMSIRIILLKKVKSYAPRVYHWVCDIELAE